MDAGAACNLVPVAKRQFASVLGGVGSPITAPTKLVDLTLTACDVSVGFEPIAAENTVTVRFEPPGGGPDTDVLIDPGTFAVSDCVLAGNRCRNLVFVMPDTTGVLPPHGLAGPARVLVRDSANTLVAEIGELLLPTRGCDRQPETVFEQLTVLPPVNSFADALTGTATQLLATVDGGGNLLVPFDYWGGGANSVLAETPGAPTAVLVEGTAEIPAMGAIDPNTIAEVVAAQSNPSSFLRAFTLNGRPLPPLLRITASGGLFGSVDAVESVVRIARNDGQGGPDLYDLSDRLSALGRGPVIIDTFNVARNDPIPLKSLRASTRTVAYARDESREDVDINADLDKLDLVVSVVDAETGVPSGTGRAVAQGATDLQQYDPYAVQNGAIVFPALGTEDDLAAFLLSEAAQGDTDLNSDGDTDDAILAVFDRFGAELTSGLDIDASTVPAFEGRPLAVSEDKVFFRSPNVFVERLTGTIGLGGASHVTISPDDAHVYVSGRDDNAIAVYARNPISGRLTFVQSVIDGGGGIDGLAGAGASVVSPDGAHLYVVGEIEDAVAVFSRNPVTGVLTFVEAEFDDVGGVDGLSGPAWVTISPDGAHVYVTGSSEHEIAIFSRNAGTGSLSFVEAKDVGIQANDDLDIAVISPDGAHVYVSTRTPVANNPSSSGVKGYARNSITGALTAVASGYLWGVNPGNAKQLAFTPDGLYLFSGVMGVGSQALRNPVSGVLTPVPGSLSSYGDSVNRNTDSVVVSANGARVYRWFRDLSYPNPDNAGIIVHRRNPLTSQITHAETLASPTPGPQPLARPQSLAETSDGRHLYVAGGQDDSVTLLRRDLSLRVFDAQTSSLRAAQPLATKAATAAKRAVFLASEELAAADLNFDGDVEDEVAHLLDVSTGADVITSIGIAANRIAISENLVALTVEEADEPTADNGDADRDDSVLAVYTLDGPPALHLTSFVADNIAVSGKRVVFTSPEIQDNSDLNLDGDISRFDRVLRVLDFTDGPPGTLTEIRKTAEDFVVDGSLIAFRGIGGFEFGDSPESGDGHAYMRIYDMDADELTSTGLAAERCDFLPGCEPRFPYRIDGARRTVSFLGWEFRNGGDLDGDGDANDLTLFVYHLPSRKAQVVAKVFDNELSTVDSQELPVLDQSFVDGFIMYVPVIESDVGEDLDGDGVITDATTVAIVGDSDGDGALDDFDTCVETVDLPQADRDVDGLGDTACDPKPPLCPPAPLVGCRAVVEAGSSKLSVDDKAGEAMDSLKWMMKKGASTMLEEFGDPVSSLPLYTLCVYDSSVNDQPLLNSVVLARRRCGSKPCWKEAGTAGLKMNDKSGFPSGVQKVSLKAGVDGETAIGIKARGAALLTPSLPWTPPITVQWIADDDISPTCWTTTFSTMQKMDATKLRAKSD